MTRIPHAQIIQVRQIAAPVIPGLADAIKVTLSAVSLVGQDCSRIL